MNPSLITRRTALLTGAKYAVGGVLAASLGVRLRGATHQTRDRQVFDVMRYGAVGDGKTLDTAAIQRAIDEAAAAGAGSQVLLRGGRRFLIGALTLRSGIDFHLADTAEIVVTLDQNEFLDGIAIAGRDTQGLSITGTGVINGRSPEFMDHFDAVNEWWRPKGFLPRILALTACRDLVIRGITLRQSPSWTMHLQGCDHLLIEDVTIRNQLDVPNCDGIDVDHCRDVEVKKCDISCGDDGIVIKNTRQGVRYGPTARIRVSDCMIATQDSGLKIGTETTQDISDVRFERCEIPQCNRGLCIQLRDEGNVSNVEFRDIRFSSRYFSDPWWGRGEGISFTAIPRTPVSKLGVMSDIRVTNVVGTAENSVRMSGSAASRIRDISFANVAMTLGRSTKYPGGVWDNRPTSAQPAIETHTTVGFSVRHADRVTLKDCRLTWAKDSPEYFTEAIETDDVTDFSSPGFIGGAAHPNGNAAAAAS